MISKEFRRKLSNLDAFANLRCPIFESTFILDVSYDAWTPLNATPRGEAGRAGWSARIGDWGICMVLEVKCQYGVERVKRVIQSRATFLFVQLHIFYPACPQILLHPFSHSF